MGGRTPPYSTLWKGRALQKREHLSLYTHITNIYLPHIQTLLLCAYNIHKYIRTIEAIENFNNYRAVITVKHRREELREREREREERSLNMSYPSHTVALSLSDATIRMFWKRRQIQTPAIAERITTTYVILHPNCLNGFCCLRQRHL